MATSTYSSTYTVADVRRVLGSFAADFAMMVATAGLSADWPRNLIDQMVADLVDFADHGYIAEVHVSLWSGGTELRAARYTPSTFASGWTNDRSGGCIWPRTPSGTITVIAVYSDEWTHASDSDKSAFKGRLQLTWAPSDVDVSHLGLAQSQDRRYASNGFGLVRLSFGG